MQQTKNLLEARRNQLLKIKKEKEKELLKAPDGTLRIVSKKKKPQFYHRIDPKDFNGKYIQEKDFKFVEKLAQKDYDQKLLKIVDQELKATEKYLALSPKILPEDVYELLHPERQKLVVPIQESDEEYVKNWENVEYEGKTFFPGSPEFYTAKGERVRSKSEVIIADSLLREGVPYRYEYPIYLDGVGIVNPDFTVLNINKRKEMCWEHLGMMDDPEYAEKAVRKISSYQQNGIFPGEQLILTYESKNHPLNQKEIIKLIEKYMK